MKRLTQLAINNDGFAFDPSTGDSYLLNKTGLVIVNGLREGMTEDEIVKSFIETYDVTPECAKRDVADFLSRLNAVHLM